MKEKKEFYTLITGSSMGIGKAMAHYCGNLKMNLLLVSLTNEGLAQLANEISEKYAVKTAFLEIDLAQLNAPQEVVDWTKNNDFTVNVLVNNAGVGGASEFDQSEIKYIDDRILLNIRSLVMLTRLFLPSLKEQPNAFILNVSSLSAFFSIPYKALYSSSKSFVVNFSRAIRYELKDTNVSISVICPNAVYNTHAKLKAHGKKVKIFSVYPETVAKKGINGMLKRKFLIIPGRANWVLFVLQKIIPNFIQQILIGKEFKKSLANK